MHKLCIASTSSIHRYFTFSLRVPSTLLTSSIRSLTLAAEVIRDIPLGMSTHGLDYQSAAMHRGITSALLLDHCRSYLLPIHLIRRKQNVLLIDYRDLMAAWLKAPRPRGPPRSGEGPPGAMPHSSDPASGQCINKAWDLLSMWGQLRPGKSALRLRQYSDWIRLMTGCRTPN